MRSIAAISTVFVLVAPFAASSNLHVLHPIDKSDVDCGCTFFEFDSNTEIELYLEGNEILFFDFSSDPPRALINLGHGNVELYVDRHSSLPFESCRRGEPFLSEWRLDELAVSVRVNATVPASESCWFGGEVSIMQTSGETSTIISGACQC